MTVFDSGCHNWQVNELCIIIVLYFINFISTFLGDLVKSFRRHKMAETLNAYTGQYYR